MKNKFPKGAKNAVKCLNIGKQDRVAIITDNSRKHIAESIVQEIKKIGCEVLWLIIEDEVGMRPATHFPKKMRNKILDFQPNVSYYIATGKKGELSKFRWPLKELLVDELKCRHGHMISIDDTIMKQGMSADYDVIHEITQKVYRIVKDALKIKVKAEGTELKATFNPDHEWVPCDGRIYEQGKWSNLPEGEVYTCPDKVNGKVKAYVMGDYFSDKYGVLRDPLIVEIKDSRVVSAECKNNHLAKEFIKYIKSEENGDRVGEFAIGTNISLKKFIGNLLQDEKFPGIHIAFGGSYSKLTKADWDCTNHLDVIPRKCSIWVEEEQIMKEGKFLI